MEHNLPVIAKRLWSIVRVVFFMLRKGISKRKLMLDLNMMMKRGKIAGKAISNLMTFHHHHHTSSSLTRRLNSHLSFAAAAAPREYEFSCSTSPAFPFHLNKRRHHFFACTHAPPTLDDDAATVNAVKVVLDVLNNNNSEMVVEASPVLPGFGFGRSPLVRQLRITDSPFPLRDIDEDGRVDKAAEEFIQKFYKELKQQKIMGF